MDRRGFFAGLASVAGLATSAHALTPTQRVVLFGSRGYDYYIDSRFGNDSGPGTRLQPFASPTPLNTLGSVRNGTRIGIAKGSVFVAPNAQLSLTSGNNVLIEAYGNGAMPYFDCRLPLAAGDWSPTVGDLGVYQQTVTLPNDISAQGNVWEGENFLTQVTSLALCLATAGTAYMSSTWTGSSATLYIHPTGSTDPRVNGFIYSYSRNLYGINLAGATPTVRGVRTRGAAYTGGSISFTSTNPNGLVDSCRLEDGGRHTTFSGAGTLYSNCYFYRVKNDLDGTAGNFIVWNQSDMTAGTCQSIGCTFDVGLGQNSDQNASAILAHDSVANRPVLSSTHSNMTLIGGTLGGAEAMTMTFNGLTLQSAVQLISFSDSSSPAVTINGLSGNIVLAASSVRAVAATVGGSLTFGPGSLTVGPINGASWLQGTSTTADFNVVCQAGFQVTLNGAGASTFVPVQIARGSFTASGMTLGPTIACPFTTLFQIGIGATGNLSLTGCTLPTGTNAIINGTTYSTIAAIQAGGFGSGNAYGAYTASFTDTFQRANQNLEASANWTNLGGVTGAYQVVSDKLSAINASATITLYAAPDLGASAAQWARGVVAGLGDASGPIGLTVRTATGDALGARPGATKYYSDEVFGGSASQLAVVSVQPVVGDVMLLSERGGFLYLDLENGQRLFGPVPTTHSHSANTKAGVAAHFSAANPLFSEVDYGVTA